MVPIRLEMVRSRLLLVHGVCLNSLSEGRDFPKHDI